MTKSPSRTEIYPLSLDIVRPCSLQAPSAFPFNLCFQLAILRLFQFCSNPIDCTLRIVFRFNKKFDIFSDYLSSLKAIEAFTPSNTLAYNVRYHTHLLKQSGKDIRFVWVPSHIGIPGNEKADKLAKEAAIFNQYNNRRTLPLCDFKTSNRKLQLKYWSDNWLETRRNKLRLTKPSVEPWESSNCASRQEELILCRLRIGHCYETHSYLLKGEDPPECDKCDLPLTVKHVLLDCPSLETARKQFFKLQSTDNLSLKLLLGKHPAIPIADINSFLQFAKFQVIYSGQ